MKHHSNEELVGKKKNPELSIVVLGYKAGEEIYIALDPATSEMYEDGHYVFWKSDPNNKRTSEDMCGGAVADCHRGIKN